MSQKIIQIMVLTTQKMKIISLLKLTTLGKETKIKIKIIKW